MNTADETLKEYLFDIQIEKLKKDKVYPQIIKSMEKFSSLLSSKAVEQIEPEKWNGFEVSIIENNIAAQDGKALLMLSSNDYKNYKNQLKLKQI